MFEAIGSASAQPSGNGRALAIPEVKPDGPVDASGWELLRLSLSLADKLLLCSCLFGEGRVMGLFRGLTVFVSCFLLSLFGGVTVIAVCVVYGPFWPCSCVERSRQPGSCQGNSSDSKGVRVLKRQLWLKQGFQFQVRLEKEEVMM